MFFAAAAAAAAAAVHTCLVTLLLWHSLCYNHLPCFRSVAWTGIRASDMLPYVATTRHHYSEQPEQDEDLWQGADDEATLDVASSASATKCSNSNMTNVTSAGGCPVVKYPWCLDSYHLNFYQFLGGGLLMAVGYPTCAVMCYAIFSKILGPFPQVSAK